MANGVITILEKRKFHSKVVTTKALSHILLPSQVHILLPSHVRNNTTTITTRPCHHLCFTINTIHTSVARLIQLGTIPPKYK